MISNLTIKQRECSGNLQLPDTHPILERIFAARNIKNTQEIDAQLKYLLNYSTLKNIDLATRILFDAIVQKRRIIIVGDFDADGATSSALAVKALTRMGAAFVSYLVPNRFEYGYGLTPEIVDLAKAREAELIVTVDNGISSIDGVRKAKQYNMQVVVTDHHLPGRTLPDADAIVNPNQPGDTFASKNLAGVGVLFYLMLSLRALMIEQRWFEANAIEVPNMAHYLDIVALGTVADVVPLDYNNRILVTHGLKRIRAGYGCEGILALLEVANRKPERINASDFAFSVAPKLNAAGRLTDMSLGIECLLATDKAKAMAYAKQLNALNTERKTIESDMKEQAEKSLEAVGLESSMQISDFGLCLYRPDWHQGVIGILAARLKEKYHRPTIVFARSEPGVIKGSARSIPGLHIRDLLDAIASSNPKLISKFGGHAMAAGMSLAEQDFDWFKQAYLDQLKLSLDKKLLEPVIYTDGELSESELTLEFAELLDVSGPWGQGFPEPLFEGKFRVLDARIVGEKHTKMKVSPENSDRTIEAIAFNYVDDSNEVDPAQAIQLVYRLVINEFNHSRSAQLMVDHVNKASN